MKILVVTVVLVLITNIFDKGVGSVAAQQNVCFKDGHGFPLGYFVDPIDKCRICRCCKPGMYSCTKRVCPEPRCGKDRQTLAKDGCCMKCEASCKSTKCGKLKKGSCKCPHYRHAYYPSSCCPVCGCELEGVAVPPGPFGHKCDRCKCWSNGKVRCKWQKCPMDLLECVDPSYNSDCEPICPNGRTCRRGNLVIKYGEIVEYRDKYCTCAKEDKWYPRGFCVRKDADGERLGMLRDDLCVADTPKLV